jgi:hypothetical protein
VRRTIDKEVPPAAPPACRDDADALVAAAPACQTEVKEQLPSAPAPAAATAEFAAPSPLAADGFETAAVTKAAKRAKAAQKKLNKASEDPHAKPVEPAAAATEPTAVATETSQGADPHAKPVEPAAVATEPTAVTTETSQEADHHAKPVEPAAVTKPVGPRYSKEGMRARAGLHEVELPATPGLPPGLELVEKLPARTWAELVASPSAPLGGIHASVIPATLPPTYTPVLQQSQQAEKTGKVPTDAGGPPTSETLVKRSGVYTFNPDHDKFPIELAALVTDPSPESLRVLAPPPAASHARRVELCAREDTCWVYLKKGYCPRGPACTWMHPPLPGGA